MQQASSSEIQSAFQTAAQAFREMKYPVTKSQLLGKAKSINARSEVIQAIENIPDKEYHSTADVLKEFEGIQNIVQAFRDVKFPATKAQLLNEAKKLNVRSEVMKSLEACPDREYTNFSDIVKECRSRSNW
jgi:chromatin segregation and condensation protein Rec8/ScpA/Scc1 (kleisin family)